MNTLGGLAAATLSLLALALLALPAAAGDLAGRYGCWIGGNMNLGTIEIDGATYRGPAFDDQWEGDYPFQTDGQVITWGGPLGGITAAGKVVSTVLTKQGFDITLQNADSGNFQSISCMAE